MEVIRNLVPASKYSIKCPFEMAPEFYVVHNTANDAPAENEIAYMLRNDNKVSFHYAIDNEKIVQGIPENRNAYHAGDGREGDGNRKGIGIEICYSLSGGEKFVSAEKLAAKFIAQGLKEKGWGIDRVKKHQDFDGKRCPHRTLDMGWQRFLDMIEVEMRETKSDTLYRVQVGAFRVKANAEKQLADLKAAGFNGFIVESKAEAAPAEPPKSAKKSIEEVAQEIVYGNPNPWGNGTERTKNLTEAGYTAEERKAIQDRVNQLLR